MPLYRAERDALEAAFHREAEEAYARWRSAGGADRAGPLQALSTSCFARAAEAETRWTRAVSAAPVQHRPPPLFTLAWDGFDKQARLPV